MAFLFFLSSDPSSCHTHSPSYQDRGLERKSRELTRTKISVDQIPKQMYPLPGPLPCPFSCILLCDFSVFAVSSGFRTYLFVFHQEAQLQSADHELNNAVGRNAWSRSQKIRDKWTGGNGGASWWQMQSKSIFVKAVNANCTDDLILSLACVFFLFLSFSVLACL